MPAEESPFGMRILMWDTEANQEEQQQNEKKSDYNLWNHNVRITNEVHQPQGWVRTGSRQEYGSECQDLPSEGGLGEVEGREHLSHLPTDVDGRKENTPGFRVRAPPLWDQARLLPNSINTSVNTKLSQEVSTPRNVNDISGSITT